MRIGIISDTHGQLHPRVAEVFREVDHIIHAGDIGGDHVVSGLRELAPLTVVDGNNDGASGYGLARVELGGLAFLVTHILPRPSSPDRHVVAALARQRADVVVFGHSHLPHDEERDGIIWFNPASAGRRRFDYPVAVGMFERRKDRWMRHHIALDERSIDALRQRMNQMA